MKIRRNLRGGISSESPKMYILRYKLALCFGSGVKIRINLRDGISPERPQMYILSCKLALCFGSGVKIIYVVVFHQKAQKRPF